MTFDDQSGSYWVPWRSRGPLTRGMTLADGTLRLGGTCPDLGAPGRCRRRRGCPGHLLHMREVTWVRMVDWAQCVSKLVTSATISLSSKIWRPWRGSYLAVVHPWCDNLR